jgi:hypothetical protein
MPVELTDRYLRIRVRDPKLFKTFRTDDIGRPGHSKRIAGIRKKTGKWETQSWLIDRKDLKKGDMRAITLLDDIRSDLSRRDREKITKLIRKLV